MEKSNLDISLNRIKSLAKECGLSLAYICRRLGVAKVYFNDLQKSNREIPTDKLKTIADILDTTPEYLRGETDIKSKKAPGIEPNAVFLEEKNIYMIPLFETVSAGLGEYAQNSIIDYVPLYITSQSEAQETMCLRVHGDSMYPKIEDGDIIQVYKQSSVDSGTIAVVLLDGEEGLVKRVEYGADWIELHSINPMYKTMRFEGRDVLRLEVVGAVKKIIKNV